MNKLIIKSQVNTLVSEAIFFLRHRASTPNLNTELLQICNRFFQLHNQIAMARSQSVHLYKLDKWNGDRQQRYRHQQRFDSINAALTDIDDVLQDAIGRFVAAVRSEFARDPYDPSDNRKSTTEKLNELADAIQEYAEKLAPSDGVEVHSPALHATVLTGPTLSAYQSKNLPEPGAGGGSLQGILVMCAIVVRLASLLPRNR